MSKSAIFGIVTAALITLATVYVYNRFSGKSITDLGKPA